jgi:hypothetical protein
MSEPPFDPDATIDERQLRPAAAPPVIAPEDAGGDTIDEWRPRRKTARPEPPGGATVDEKRPPKVAPCPQCGTMIDAGAVLCPICNKPTGKRAVPEGAVAIITAIVVVLVVLYFVWDCVGGG